MVYKPYSYTKFGREIKVLPSSRYQAQNLSGAFLRLKSVGSDIHYQDRDEITMIYFVGTKLLATCNGRA